ncbi:hypothetical protein AE07_02031 [Enterobacter cloacae BWH 43]|nr:hypothetical protein AE07_02031 [Enterobacter cloacae BWH 43]
MLMTITAMMTTVLFNDVNAGYSKWSCGQCQSLRWLALFLKRLNSHGRSETFISDYPVREPPAFALCGHKSHSCYYGKSRVKINDKQRRINHRRWFFITCNFPLRRCILRGFHASPYPISFSVLTQRVPFLLSGNKLPFVANSYGRKLPVYLQDLKCLLLSDR